MEFTVVTVAAFAFQLKTTSIVLLRSYPETNININSGNFADIGTYKFQYLLVLVCTSWFIGLANKKSELKKTKNENVIYSQNDFTNIRRRY